MDRLHEPLDPRNAGYDPDVRNGPRERSSPFGPTLSIPRRRDQVEDHERGVEPIHSARRQDLEDRKGRKLHQRVGRNDDVDPITASEHIQKVWDLSHRGDDLDVVTSEDPLQGPAIDQTRRANDSSDARHKVLQLHTVFQDTSAAALVRHGGAAASRHRVGSWICPCSCSFGTRGLSPRGRRTSPQVDSCAVV